MKEFRKFLLGDPILFVLLSIYFSGMYVINKRGIETLSEDIGVWNAVWGVAISGGLIFIQQVTRWITKKPAPINWSGVAWALMCLGGSIINFGILIEEYLGVTIHGYGIIAIIIMVLGLKYAWQTLTYTGR